MLDELFGLEKNHKIAFGDDVDLLTTVYDEGSLAIIRGLLEAENIPYLAKERGSGSAMRIMTGFSMFGTDIFVPVAALERARELLPSLDGECEYVEDIENVDGTEAEDAE